MYGELPSIETADGNSIPAIPIAIPNPHKVAALRLPTSEEIAAYTGSIRTLLYRTGRGQTEDQNVPNHEAERKLFDAIRLDKSGTEFDEAEVTYALNIVLKHNTVSCDRDADEFVVALKTLWGRTIHRCRMPITREIQAYRDNVIKSRGLRHGAEEQRYPPEVPTALYDAIVVSVDGYAPSFNVPAGTVNGNRHVIEGVELKAFLGKIPPHHKRSVAAEVSGALYDLDPQLDPNG